MDRRKRLKWLCTKEGMREAARVQRRRRGQPDDPGQPGGQPGEYHRYVVGQFFMIGRRVVLKCVRTGGAYYLPRPPEFTDDARDYFRWRTRQAAHQFATRWRIPNFHIFNMDFLDVIPDGAAAAAFAGSQSTRCAEDAPPDVPGQLLIGGGQVDDC